MAYVSVPKDMTEVKTRYPLYRRLGGPQARSGRVRKISPPQRDSIPRPSSPQRVAIPTELSRPIYIYIYRERERERELRAQLYIFRKMRLYHQTPKDNPEFSLIEGPCSFVGRDSLVGVETGNAPDGPGIESGVGENFRTLPDRPCGPPSLLYNGYRVFPGGKAAEA